jgi:putative oxidoreductase
MNALIALHERLGTTLSAAAPQVMPLLARLVFAGVLLAYFWASATTKLGEGATGFLHPSDGAYAQIFPRAFEAAGYDSGQLGLFHWCVAVAGTWAEFILPTLIVVGLLTRYAAVGMLGFVLVQSLTDIWGHAVDAATVGRWFDRVPDALILDQRALWVVLLLVLATMGGGKLSLDAAFARRFGAS